MADLRSPHWDEVTGMCLKHSLPTLPCPRCAEEKCQDVEVYYNLIDLDMAAYGRIPLSDLLPANFNWVSNVV